MFYITLQRSNLSTQVFVENMQFIHQMTAIPQIKRY